MLQAELRGRNINPNREGLGTPASLEGCNKTSIQPKGLENRGNRRDRPGGPEPYISPARKGWENRAETTSAVGAKHLSTGHG